MDLERQTKYIPSSAQDGLVWRWRRGGEYRVIVIIVVPGVFGDAAGVVHAVEHDAGTVWEGRGEGHERETRRKGVPSPGARLPGVIDLNCRFSKH